MELSFVPLAATQFRDFCLPIWYLKMKDYNTHAVSFACRGLSELSISGCRYLKPAHLIPWFAASKSLSVTGRSD